MPDYLLRYFVLTPLRSHEDLSIRYAGNDVHFLFQRAAHETGIEVEVVLGSDSYRAATLLAEQTIYPVLDVLAFWSKGSALLQELTLALKAQSGANRRKAILVDPSRQSQRLSMHRGDQEAVNNALTRYQQNACLRWLRGSYSSSSALDRFVFSWLALETLAGEVERNPPCPNCGRPTRSYRTVDRDAAFGIMRNAEPSLSRGEFEDWFRTRNDVLHGRRQLDGTFLGQLLEISRRVTAAVEPEAARRVGVTFPSWRLRDSMPAIRDIYMHYFIEFDAEDPRSVFPSRIPEAARLTRLIEARNDPREELGTTLLDAGAFLADF